MLERLESKRRNSIRIAAALGLVASLAVSSYEYISRPRPYDLKCFDVAFWSASNLWTRNYAVVYIAPNITMKENGKSYSEDTSEQNPHVVGNLAVYGEAVSKNTETAGVIEHTVAGKWPNSWPWTLTIPIAQTFSDLKVQIEQYGLTASCPTEDLITVPSDKNIASETHITPAALKYLESQ